MWLSIIVVIPVIAAIILSLFPKSTDANVFRYGTLLATFAVLAAVIMAFFFPGTFQVGEPDLQHVELRSWIGSQAFTIDYFMGIDGISFPLIVLTAGVSILAMIASWSITKQVKGYCILFLLLETGMLGVFLALDFFLFYIFWEVMLLPMYFLIGIWGGPRKEYAAIKFFLYTLFGSVLMLIAILMLYFASDLNVLDEQTLISTHVVKTVTAEDGSVSVVQKSMDALRERGYTGTVGDTKVHTFNIAALAAMGQNGSGLFDGELLFGWKLQHWAFILLFIGFAIKVPSVPVHTWLPDAHVEAPTPISMILAGILLKMGGYGILRICYPICPEAGYDFRWFVCTIGVVSMVPNLVPIVGVFGAMGLLDIPLDTSVFPVAVIALGIAVDDTIHFMARYSHELRQHEANEDAIRSTIEHEFRPVVTSSAALIAGFFVLTFASFGSIQQFGLLAAIAMVLAVLADLIVTPALLVTTPIVNAWDMLQMRLPQNFGAKSELLRGLTKGEMRRVAGSAIRKSYAPGEVMLRQGETGRDMLLILSGSTEVAVQEPDGTTRHLAETSTGSALGERGFLTNRPRAVNVTARDEVEALQISANTLDRIKSRNPRLAAKLLHNIAVMLADRLHTTQSSELEAPSRS